MDREKIKLNAGDLERELDWLTKLLTARFKSRRNGGGNNVKIKPPDLRRSKSPYAEFIRQYKFVFEERFMMILALAPHLKPRTFDSFYDDLKQPGNEIILSGKENPGFKGFIPTGETAIFILSGDSLEQHFFLQELLNSDQKLFKENILELVTAEEGEPDHAGFLLVSHRILDQLKNGQEIKPEPKRIFDGEFLVTEKQWQDLLLADEILEQLKMIGAWAQISDKQVADGCKALFEGKQITGKILAAALLGKESEKMVYRVDLSQVTSKFIGETEKNLSSLFKKAAEKDWILFFDEADALFGSRTQVRDSHDRYTNQEINYFLRLIDEYNGVIIFSLRSPAKLNRTFLKCMDIVVRFPNPDERLREKIWKSAIPQDVRIDRDVNFKELAKNYELRAGDIDRALDIAFVHMNRENSGKLTKKHLEYGIDIILRKNRIIAELEEDSGSDAGGEIVVREIRSNSGLRILFDDENSTLLLETPIGNKIQLDDNSDKISITGLFGSKIEMSSSGVLIESFKDLRIKAGMNLKLEGVDIDLYGMNINQTAHDSFKAEAGSAAELKSNGSTIVKGTTVLIN